MHLVIVALFYTAARTGLITVISLSPRPRNFSFNWGDSNETFRERLIINLPGTAGNPHEGVHAVERGNGCNHLSASASTSFIIAPDVVFVVDAAVVFFLLFLGSAPIQDDLFGRGKWIVGVRRAEAATVARFA